MEQTTALQQLGGARDHGDVLERVVGGGRNEVYSLERSAEAHVMQDEARVRAVRRRNRDCTNRA